MYFLQMRNFVFSTAELSINDISVNGVKVREALCYWLKRATWDDLVDWHFCVLYMKVFV